MKNTASKAFGISFGFHLLMALLAVWVLSVTHPPMDAMRIPLKPMSLVSLSEPVPLPLSVPTVQKSSSETKPAPIKPLTPQPVISKPIVPAPPAPVQTAQTLPAPAAGVAQNVANSESTTAVLRSSPSAETKTAPLPAPAKERPKADTGAEMQAFKTALRAKIQQNLRYPSAARRRGMEGEVDVRFVLENSGTIRDINVRRGEGVFHDAARLAVTSASGMKIPESLAANFPEEMAITLEFRLN